MAPSPPCFYVCAREPTIRTKTCHYQQIIRNHSQLSHCRVYIPASTVPKSGKLVKKMYLAFSSFSLSVQPPTPHPKTLILEVPCLNLKSTNDRGLQKRIEAKETDEEPF